MTMSNDVSLVLPSTTNQQANNIEIQWREIVEKQRSISEPISIKISEINDVIDRDKNDVREGDELIVSGISVKSVQLSLADTYESTDSADRERIVLPINFGGKYEAWPRFDPSHVFTSVDEIIGTYPFICDIIYPKEPFTIENIEISAWEILQIVTMVQGTPHNQLLVNVVRQKREILLPSTLQVEFLQWNHDWALRSEPDLKSQQSQEYSLAELIEFWSLKLHPATIKIHQQSNFCEMPIVQRSSNRETFSRKLSSIFKPKPEKKSTSNLIINEDEDEDYWMIPEAWKSQEMVLEPIQVVHVTNVNTSEKFDLPGELDMKVIVLSSNETSRSFSIESYGDDILSDNLSLRSSRSSSENSIPLQQLDILSLVGNKSRNDAIVAVVTNGLHSGGRHPNNLSFGSLLAIHRTRRVRKLLVMTNDAQYFLVSAHYSGIFERLPLVFGCAGEVPTGNAAVYVTRCTAYPVDKQLDSCHEGQFVRFQKKSKMVLNNVDTTVVHCMVSSSIDGQQCSATYPADLPGSFEKVDASSTELTIHELYKTPLPVCARIEKSDSSLGFDPLAYKKNLIIKKVVTETTVIIESLRKCEDGIHSAGAIFELPIIRNSLLVRELVNDPYPRRKEFQGLQKLPCVEMLAERDVVDLEESSRSLSTTSILSPTEGEEKTIDSSSPSKQSKIPQYTLVAKNKTKSDVEDKTISPSGRKTPVFEKENNEKVSDLNEQETTCNEASNLESHELSYGSTMLSFDNPTYKTAHFVKPFPLPRRKYLSTSENRCHETLLPTLSNEQRMSKSVNDILTDSDVFKKSPKKFLSTLAFSSEEYLSFRSRNDHQDYDKFKRKARSLENIFRASAESFNSLSERGEVRTISRKRLINNNTIR